MEKFDYNPIGNNRILKILFAIKNRIEYVINTTDPERIKLADEVMGEIIPAVSENAPDENTLVNQMTVHYVAFLSENKQLYLYLTENGIPREYFISRPYLIWNQITNNFTDRKEYLCFLKRFPINSVNHILFDENVDKKAVKKLLIERDFEKAFLTSILNFLDSELIDILGADFILHLSENGYENLAILIKRFGMEKYNQYKEEVKEQLRPLLLKFKDIYTIKPDIKFQMYPNIKIENLLNLCTEHKIIELADKNCFFPMCYAEAAALDAVDVLEQLIELEINFVIFVGHNSCVFNEIIQTLKETNFFDRDPSIFSKLKIFGNWVDIIDTYKASGLEAAQNHVDILTIGRVNMVINKLKRK